MNHSSPTEESNWSKTLILKDVPEGDILYYVHSYVVVPEDKDSIISETDYDPNRFCSVIKKDNIIGCKFHLKKVEQ
tara:strand:- start:1370 stop:1597 length:228 start_codon:yes stop_codon:yes gene_type:complete